jgi:predicted amidohydrolase YtcJ
VTDHTAATIYRNGHVITGDPAQPVAQAVAVLGERIAAVGDEDAVRAVIGPGARTVDLEGRCVIPGLTDTHSHVAGHALENRTVECRDFVDPRVDSIAEMMRRMADAAARQVPGDWVIGTGAMRQVARLRERRWPTRAELDEATGALPSYVAFGSHVTVANSAALELAGIDAATPDPAGGRIIRGEDGELTGLLLEHAGNPLRRDLARMYGFDALVDALESSLLQCAARGVTCIHDIVDKPDYVRAYQALHRSGRLPIRVSLLYRVVNAGFPLEFLPGVGLQTGFGDDMLWLGGGKISIDGGFTGRSAAFAATIDGRPLCDPIIRVPQEDLVAAARLYEEAGVRLCVHAIGDLAVDWALDAFEKAGADGRLRHRIEHFGNWLCTPERLQRAQSLGVTPVPNPPFLYYLGEDAWNLLGGEEHYAGGAFPFRTLVQAGFHLTGGSDGPGYYGVDGLRDLGTMVRRVSYDGRVFDPAENLTVPEALHAQTASAAWLGYREGSLGSLSPGKYADFVVLDCPDLYACDPSEIAGLDVRATVVNGRPVHGAAGPMVTGGRE